tara:strand:+ start:396 stop:734 length:339 start_codon:yes stop_codon:yes gene_type:complete
MIHWEEYLKKLKSNGNQNLLAILKMDKPKLVDQNTIEFNVVNSINKVELTNEIDSILVFLKNKLNNHKIKFIINIIKKNNSSFIYTPEEKFKKMKSINPAIQILKKTFDLNL